MATAGTVIGGRFRVDHVLGSGGMGLVVAATHLQLGHRVAIKFLLDEMAGDATVNERFLREARAVVQLRTEHVCRVIDAGQTDTGAPYMVMELLEGTDLGRAVAHQPLPAVIAVEYVMQACVAIAEAHAAGIIHRDLKPANLFVVRRPGGGPLIKVLDFGIAKARAEAGARLTHSHSILGSPAYISPEQLQSARDVDVRADIWSLGATLYQLLSARLPFYRPNVTEMAVRIVMEPPDPLDVDPALRAVVLRCLEKSPALRYPDVAALVTDLAPFGGPSARAIAAMVGQLVRGATPPPAAAVSPFAMTAGATVASVATPPPAPAISPFAMTAGASVASVDPRSATPSETSAPTFARAAARPPTAPAGAVPATAAPTFPRAVARPPTAPAGAVPATAALAFARPPTAPAGAVPATAAPTFARTPSALLTGAVARPPHRRRWWWLAAPLVVVVAALAALVHPRPAPIAGAAPGTVAAVAPGPVAAVAPGPVAAVAPADAGAPELAPDAPPPDAGPLEATLLPPPPSSVAKDPRPATRRGKPAPATAPRAAAAGAPPAAAAGAPPAAASGNGRGAARSPTTGGAVAATAREAKDTCFEATGDTPWNTAMCWCTKKDRARAQAAFARLSGFKRLTVRNYCAVRGIDL